MRECNFFCPEDISDPQQIVVCLYGYVVQNNKLVDKWQIKFLKLWDQICDKTSEKQMA